MIKEMEKNKIMEKGRKYFDRLVRIWILILEKIIIKIIKIKKLIFIYLKIYIKYRYKN